MRSLGSDKGLGFALGILLLLSDTAEGAIIDVVGAKSDNGVQR